MTHTRIIDGRALGGTWLVQVATQLRSRKGRAPRLVIVQVGDNPASSVYVSRKIEAAQRVGILAEKLHLRADEGEAALHSTLHALAHDAATDAMLVQTPLPRGWDAQAALNMVPWHKDVDGLSAESERRRAAGEPCHLPATPAAVLRLMTEELQLPLTDLPIAVIGNGRVVGAPLRALLAQRGAQVLPIDRDTPHPQAISRAARVVVAACGVPELVNEHWISPNTIVIDVGLTPTETPEGKRVLKGDVAANRIEGIAAARTPAPGGVGPLTVAQLLTNVGNIPSLTGTD